MSVALRTCSYYICERLEGPFWAWVATLAAAIYAGYPSQCALHLVPTQRFALT